MLALLAVKVPVEVDGGPMVDCAARHLVQLLERKVRRLEKFRGSAPGNFYSSGCRELDRLLPEGGFRDGSLVEWLSRGGGSGAGTLSLVVARQAVRSGGAVVVMDRHCDFYLPAAAGLGIDLQQLIVVRARDEREELWALDQSLRCPAVAAVWATLGKRSSRDIRRLQLAVEQGGGLGLLLRPASIRGQPGWSDIQLLVEPRAAQGHVRRWRVEVVKCRGGRSGAVVELEMDEVTGTVREASGRHETHPLPMAPSLAAPTLGRRSARA